MTDPTNTNNEFDSGYNTAKLDYLFQKIEAMDRKLDTITNSSVANGNLLSTLTVKIELLEKERIPDHESRIRGLEKSDKIWAGVVVLISAIVTILIRVFFH